MAASLPSMPLWLKELVNVDRFPCDVSNEEKLEQLKHRDKAYLRLGLSAFQATNEREDEQWVDDAARRTRVARTCLRVSRDAWASVAPATQSSIIVECVADS